MLLCVFGDIECVDGGKLFGFLERFSVDLFDENLIIVWVVGW